MEAVSIEQALASSNLTDEMPVVLKHIKYTNDKDMVEAHTGTIKTIDWLRNTITFNFPKKGDEPTVTMSLDAFIFPDLEDTSGKTFYLVAANAQEVASPTAAIQQTGQFNHPATYMSTFGTEASAQAAAYVKDMNDPIPEQEPKRRLFGIKRRKPDR